MKIELQTGENLVINLGDRGAVVIAWTESFDSQLNEFQLDENCKIYVANQPDTSLRYQEIKTRINPKGSLEISLEKMSE